MAVNQVNPQGYALLDVKGGEQNSGAEEAPPKRRKGGLAKEIIESRLWQTLSMLALMIALFGGGILSQFNPPDEVANMPMDILMTTITVFFICEITLRCIGERKEYPFSFFFWMDMIGTASMAFEISYLLGEAGKIQKANNSTSTVVVRSARAARIGARAGRLSRPLRLLNTILKRADLDTQEAGYSAKVLGQKLTQVFSSKVAMLTVVLVLGVPMFNIGRYPEDDFSMKSWGSKIEADYARDFHYATDGQDKAAHAFNQTVTDMTEFYTHIGDYFPYRFEGYPTSVTVHGKTVKIEDATMPKWVAPMRKQNILRQTVASCRLVRPGCDENDKAAIYFNFTASNKYDEMMDMFVTIFIILCMMIESCDLSFSVDRMMVKPMERMLDSARLMAKQLNQAMSRGKPGKMNEAAKSMAKDMQSLNRNRSDDDDSDEDETQNEIETLQALFKKVVFLINVFMEQDVAEQTEGLDENDQGVMVDIAKNTEATKKQSVDTGTVEGFRRQQSLKYMGASSFAATSSVLTTPGTFAPVVPTGIEAVPATICQDNKSIMSWGLDVSSASAADCHAKVYECLFTSDVGQLSGQVYLEPAQFKTFMNEIEGVYNKGNPYHNFQHATEVCVSCYRWLRQMQWVAWLPDLDATALMVCAVAGDLGHPGRTNQFLLETGDPLALTYNDQSPLENMHCAKLFDICKNPETDVFARLDKTKLRYTRAVCIEAILNTDNSMHFDIVKAVKKIYGMASDMCDSQATNPTVLAQQYIADVLHENSSLWRKVILHLSDISNQALKFPVAQLWAKCIMNEFFIQGDEEKKLGIPVGLLNDRDKVSTAGSQFGFTTMLFTPLVVSVIHIFPMIGPIAEQSYENAEAWNNEWKKEPSYKLGAQAEKLRKFKEQLAKFVKADSITPRSKQKSLAPAEAGLITMESAGICNLAGSWTCTATWGLEEFLKSTNVSWARRKAAMGAPWPSWEFQQSGDHVVFVNNSAVGVLREEITANRQKFTIVDGWKQVVNCLAYWENGALVIEKDGPQGKFREERTIDSKGKLQFTLQPVQPAGVKWGRTFEPKKKK